MMKDESIEICWIQTNTRKVENKKRQVEKALFRKDNFFLSKQAQLSSFESSN